MDRTAADAPDALTAAAFATSWNTVGHFPVYSREQFGEWLAPISPQSVEGESVLELGFGNGSLLYHMATLRPARLCGIELGDTLAQTRSNLAHVPEGMLDLHRGDLVTTHLGHFDLVYCIGVLHHLEDPRAGFEAVLRQTRPGGRFHCCVYAEEGNAAVIRAVDPIRRAAWHLPWWLTKYGVALPLAVPYYAYAKAVRALSPPDLSGTIGRLVSRLPLAGYSRWIAGMPFGFVHHVAFDQLVSPRTGYLSRAIVDSFLGHPDVEPGSAYVVHRNGNSWKFGGRRRRT
jgi:SAM-dependent methyltransferase